MKGFRTSNSYVKQLGALYAKVPKAVLAAIAVSSLTCGGDYIDRAEELLLWEWSCLWRNGIVPQKPPRVIEQEPGDDEVVDRLRRGENVY